jgi:hypothetical protein
MFRWSKMELEEITLWLIPGILCLKLKRGEEESRKARANAQQR